MGKRVLIVEDEWLIAEDLTRALVKEGAHIVGPAASVDHATYLLETYDVDVAILDVHLAHNCNVYALAETLQGRGVPFIFATGCDEKNIRHDFAHVPHLLKPYELATVGQTLFEVIIESVA